MLIGFTGRIGAGKETLKSYLTERGFVYIVTSDLLNKELLRRGKKITRTNQQDLGDELRGQHGPGALMRLLLEQIDSSVGDYILDSLRNAREARYLKDNTHNFVLFAVDAPQRERWKRIQDRGKPSDPQTWEDFLKIDERDYDGDGNPMGQQVRLCMETADYVIDNSSDLEISIKEIERIWNEIKHLSVYSKNHS